MLITYEQARAIVQAEIAEPMVTAAQGREDGTDYQVPYGLAAVLDGTWDPKQGPPTMMPEVIAFVNKTTGALKFASPTEHGAFQKIDMMTRTKALKK